MATDIRPTTPDGAPIDERVRHPLERLRSIIRRYVLLEGLALVGLFLVLWFWVGLALDYGVFRATGLDWVQEVPWAARAAVLGLVVAALLTLVTFRVLTRLFRDFSHRSLALVLERRFPRALGDRLITAVELADLDRAEQLGYSREMIRKTVEDAKARVDRIPLGDVFNWRRLAGKGLLLGAVLFGGLGVVLVGGVLYSALAAKPLAGFARQSRDVAVIWVERNLLLHNTPWPRDTYLEFLDFPGEERRIGRDGASPRIRVAAWKWVIADEGTPD
ncbi:MAG TPA: hypothetical protein VIL46_05545, partial [Gemmataceae bacterium]